MRHERTIMLRDNGSCGAGLSSRWHDFGKDFGQIAVRGYGGRGLVDCAGIESQCCITHRLSFWSPFLNRMVLWYGLVQKVSIYCTLRYVWCISVRRLKGLNHA